MQWNCSHILALACFRFVNPKVIVIECENQYVQLLIFRAKIHSIQKITNINSKLVHLNCGKGVFCVAVLTTTIVMVGCTF